MANLEQAYWRGFYKAAQIYGLGKGRKLVLGPPSVPPGSQTKGRRVIPTPLRAPPPPKEPAPAPPIADVPEEKQQ